MKKLAFTTAIALALATAAYAQDHHGGGRGPGPGMGGGGGGPSPSFSQGAGGGGPGPSFNSAPRGPSGPTTSMGPNRGASTLYNRAPTNMNSYKQGGQKFDKYGEGKYGKYGDHEGKYGDHEGKYGDHDHHGVVSGNFYEHGRHFRFRRFFHGEWVFLNDWDDCTAWVWVHVAPATWVWRPVDICIG